MLLGRLFYATLLVVGVALIVAALLELLADQREYAFSRKEYNRLAMDFSGKRADTSGSDGVLSGEFESEFVIEPSRSVPERFDDLPERARLSDLTGINPDFVGWIAIEGTAVNYPVVRGFDNEVYLDTLFTGWRNQSGSVFMDYRCELAFSSPVCILYGHNMRDGSMFAALVKYLEPEFMANHPLITITMPDGETLIYRIFDARLTNAWDQGYSVDFSNVASVGTIAGTFSGAERVLLLSTCLGSAGKDARLLVYAEYRKEY